jgi:hypothetical protein
MGIPVLLARGTRRPSVVDSSGWVKIIPNAHNGYYHTKLEIGYAGFALLLFFIIATLHAVGRVADRDPARAWLCSHLLSLLSSFIISLKACGCRGFEFMWVVFLVLVARNCSIPSAFAAEKGGIRADLETRQSLPPTCEAARLDAHGALASARP